LTGEEMAEFEYRPVACRKTYRLTALAWNLKAWWALSLPEPPGERGARERPDKHRVLRMEFKTFLQAFLRLPCQIVHSGRRLIYRLLSWNPWSGVFFRLVDRLHT
jgi:hypothetical protein